MNTSQRNIEYLNKNIVLYHTRAERTAYMAAVVNKDFVCSTDAAQAIFEFITGDQLSTYLFSEDAASAARFALNCQDSDIIVDTRKLNARPKHNTIDQL